MDKPSYLVQAQEMWDALVEMGWDQIGVEPFVTYCKEAEHDLDAAIKQWNREQLAVGERKSNPGSSEPF
jgi:hypothetical protein